MSETVVGNNDDYTLPKDSASGPPEGMTRHSRANRRHPVYRPHFEPSLPEIGGDVATGDRLGLHEPIDIYRQAGKRILDILLVLAVAPIAVLLIAVPALLLWWEGGAPFYRQARLGRNGRTFQIVKLRTMVRDADAQLEGHLNADPAARDEWDRTQKLKHDPRITVVGALLRKTSLDELPQIWNVLKGDMSLVGPRPMLPEQLALYGDARHYFALLPGITGYWQVSQRNQSAFRARIAFDAEYDYNLSLTEDLKVIFRTFGAVIRRTGY